MNTNCPADVEAQTRPACYQTHVGTAFCDVCGAAMCPVCHRHNVIQLSRVTGYVSNVDGWNEGKKQEFRDRKRYEIGGE